MARATRVAIWASELEAGALPPVCVKSGRPADSTLTFEFHKQSQLAIFAFGLLGLLAGKRVHGRLPMTRRWRRTFIAFRAVAIMAAAIAVAAIFSIGAVDSSMRPAWFLFALAMFVAYVVTHTLYAGLRPKGDVDTTPEGLVWVELAGVHPNFVAALEDPTMRPKGH